MLSRFKEQVYPLAGHQPSHRKYLRSFIPAQTLPDSPFPLRGYGMKKLRIHTVGDEEDWFARRRYSAAQRKRARSNHDYCIGQSNSQATQGLDGDKLDAIPEPPVISDKSSVFC
jgi:hypothetical protein